MKLNLTAIKSNTLILATMTGALYFLIARLGLLLAFENTNASPVWMPSGLALALVVIFGRRIWSGIFIGAFAANLTVFLLNYSTETSTIIYTSLSIAAGNTLEALLGKYLLMRLVGSVNILEKYHNIFKFILVALIASFVSCTIGVVSLGIAEIIPWKIFGMIWYTWLLGDFSGILIITPLILVWHSDYQIKWKFKSVAEPILITVLVIFLAEAIFIQGYPIGDLSKRLYVIVPFLLWMVFRFGHREIISVLTIVSAFAIWGTVNGRGPFNSPVLNDSLLQLISFISIITITFMALSASLNESRQSMNELKIHKNALELKIVERTKVLEQANINLSKEVTEKENAQIILRNKTNQLDEAQRMAHIGSWEWDIKTGNEIWSDEQFRIFGFDPHNTIASYELFLNSLHPDDKQGVLLSVKEAMDGIKDFNMEYRIIRSDGLMRNIEARGQIFRDSNGNPEKMIGTVRDITESRKSEQEIVESNERFFKIFNNNPVAMMLTSMETTKHEFVNDSFLILTGYSTEEVIGKSSFEMNLVSAEVGTKFGNKLKSDGFIKNMEAEIINKYGETICVLVSLEIIEIGKEKFVLSSMHDIQQRKKVELMMEYAKKQAEESSMMKEVFLANMSHEIRTPMNAIVGFTSILNGTTLNTKQTEILSNINSASENLLGIINNILDYSKLEAGMLNIENTVMNLPAIVKSVHNMALGSGREKDLEISLYMSPTLPEYILCDPTRISQILLNLTNNAIKFTEKGYVNIRVESSLLESDKYLIKFIVSDSGIGIAEENREIIFERFAQEKVDTTRKYGGTGLGLSIVKNIVSLMKGEIIVESRLGKGSEFIISIPAGKCNNEQIIEHIGYHSSDFSPSQQKIERLNILLAEDNHMNREYCSMLLGEFGFTCTVACNGKEALQKLEGNETFDLILMDLQMPEMDGYETTRILRDELKIKIPVIAITANAMAGEQKKCSEAGMNGYLTKPFMPKILKGYINEVLLNRTDKPRNATDSMIKTKSYSGKLIDVNFLNEQSLGKTERIKDLIQIFLTDMPHDLNELGQLIVTENYKGISEKSHQMISSFSILGVTKAIEILKTIETNAGFEKEFIEIAQGFRQLENLFTEVKIEINEINV